MTLTHTPGPWHVSQHATPEGIYQASVYSSSRDARDLAIVTSRKCDARLIAVAPDLLHAAIHVIDTIGEASHADALGTLADVVYEATSA